MSRYKLTAWHLIYFEHDGQLNKVMSWFSRPWAKKIITSPNNNNNRRRVTHIFVPLHLISVQFCISESSERNHPWAECFDLYVTQKKYEQNNKNFHSDHCMVEKTRISDYTCFDFDLMTFWPFLFFRLFKWKKRRCLSLQDLSTLWLWSTRTFYKSSLRETAL